MASQVAKKPVPVKEAAAISKTIPDPKTTPYIYSTSCREHLAWLEKVFEGTTKEFWVTKGEPELVVHSEVVLGNDTKVWMASLQWDPLTQTDCTSTQLTELDRANVGKGVVQDAPEAAASPAKRKREEDGAATGTAASAKSQCRAYVEFKTKTEVDRVFETGISVGGTAQQKPFDAFWGMYWSELVDPWGTVWLICAPQPKAEAAEAKTE